MKAIQLMGAAVLGALALMSGVASAGEPENRAQCERYAKEDGIPAAELEQYMQECTSNLAENSAIMDDTKPAKD